MWFYIVGVWIPERYFGPAFLLLKRAMKLGADLDLDSLDLLV